MTPMFYAYRFMLVLYSMLLYSVTSSRSKLGLDRSFSRSLSRILGLSLAFRMNCSGTRGLPPPEAGLRVASRSGVRTSSGLSGALNAGMGLRNGVRGGKLPSERTVVDSDAVAASVAEVIAMGTLRQSGGDMDIVALRGCSASESANRSRRYRDNSTQPPPTRTMTVLERRMRQKHRRSLPPVPIQYRPDSSCHPSGELRPTGTTGTFTWMSVMYRFPHSRPKCLRLGRPPHPALSRRELRA